MAVNNVSISGNLTRDAELRQTNSGLGVLCFSVAVNDRRKNPSTGEWEDYPNYIDCTLFGARANSISQYMTRGTKVAVGGKLRWSQWETNGQKRSKVEVVVEEVEFMSRANGAGAEQHQQANTYAPQQQTTPQHQPQQVQATVYDEDIPF